jgi:hypothetical protein
MSVEVAGYRSRKRSNEARRAAKAKKEKILLAVCGVVFLGLLALQGPKMLKKLHGSGAVAPSAVAPSTSATPDAAAAASASTAKTTDLQATKHFPSKDPFIAQLDTGAAAAPVLPAATAPPVRASHFVKKDPFIQQVSFADASAAPSPSPSPTPPRGKQDGGKPAGHRSASGGNYIVMVASILVSEGRGAARAAAATARSHGVPSVKIVESSRYPTLRTGFYAVYSGPYPTLGDLLPALEQVRGDGYASAYTRRLAH